MTRFTEWERGQWEQATATGFCWRCGRYLRESRGGAAHIIADTLAHRREYGRWVLAHRDNLLLSCNGACNDAAMGLTEGEIAKKKHATSIARAIFNDVARGRIEIPEKDLRQIETIIQPESPSGGAGTTRGA